MNGYEPGSRTAGAGGAPGAAGAPNAGGVAAPDAAPGAGGPLAAGGAPGAGSGPALGVDATTGTGPRPRDKQGNRVVPRLGSLLRPTPLNPLIELELRARMRRGRTMALLLAFTGSLGALLVIALTLTGAAAGNLNGPSPFAVSYTVFQAIMVAELVLVGAVAAATAAGGISGERERQTWEVLLTTRLPAWRIVTGKLLTAVLLVMWLVVASLPVFLPLFRFGAVSPGNLARILGIFLASGLAWAAIGLFFSALLKRTIAAVIASYATATAWVILTIVARFVWDAIENARSPLVGPGAPTRPAGPYLIELMNPLLVLLRTMSSPVLDFVDWRTSGGTIAQSVSLTVGARLAGALGPNGYYWVYILSALALTAVLSALTTRLVARRRA